MSVELPKLPEPVRTSSDQAYLGFTADQMREYARRAVDIALERAEQECIETAAELRRCADGCTDGRYDWKADGADDCADAIRALGRQHD